MLQGGQSATGAHARHPLAREEESKRCLRSIETVKNKERTRIDQRGRADSKCKEGGKCLWGRKSVTNVCESWKGAQENGQGGKNSAKNNAKEGYSDEKAQSDAQSRVMLPTAPDQ